MSGRVWPHTTPSGHTYERPVTYWDLRARHLDVMQGEVERWDAAELPPAPTWDMIGLAHEAVETALAERDRARAVAVTLEQENAELRRAVADSARACFDCSWHGRGPQFLAELDGV